MVKKVLLGLGGGIILLIAVVLFNTFTLNSIQKKVDPVEKVSIRSEAINNLVDAVKLKTISLDGGTDDLSPEFTAFGQLIAERYPLAAKHLKKDWLQIFPSLLFTWAGSDPGLKPVVLMSHIDVVPVEDETLGNWEVDPFSGEIRDGVVWGRGTMDIKQSLIAIMESVEMLLQEDFQPKRTIYLAFGHDEEIGGDAGAANIVALLKKRGVNEAEFVLDEGLAIIRELIPGLKRDAALIGISEKASYSVKLSTHIEGGHSSMPAPESAIPVLSSAIAKLNSTQLPATISVPMEGFMLALGPEMSFVNRMAMANKWLFKPLIISNYEASGSGNALVRSTTAPTIFHAGIKDNVIPTTASAVVNFRILPGETSNSILTHIEKVVDDSRIKITPLDSNITSSDVADIQSFGYQTVETTIRQIFPTVLVAPSMFVASTDSKHYKELTPNILRFVPIIYSPENIKAPHGVNERIPVSEFEDCIRFYRQLILQL